MQDGPWLAALLALEAFPDEAPAAVSRYVDGDLEGKREAYIVGIARRMAEERKAGRGRQPDTAAESSAAPPAKETRDEIIARINAEGDAREAQHRQWSKEIDDGFKAEDEAKAAAARASDGSGA